MLDKLFLLYNWIWGIPMICIREMPVGRNAGENRRTLELNFEKKRSDVKMLCVLH